ncbi:TPA: type 4b pilus protein PilO2 [Escherichia coli]|uniref:type 4b pilus protein PilO2 n=1 Tax=Citrobacter TaxID=544 RepID=UPI00127021D4|nr:type 4b pilus protein PilO2 [Citrobacter sp. S39]ECE8411174.1 pilus assembly protein PilO [Salmonella enterica subsp. enterica serovar Anatum]ECL5445023.1 pilus assembly protein PilO [Salmonella enterica]EDM7166898.1 pilus assembly protein PilO [Salmonella enterica subsp. enterica serovar Litchfield]EFE0694927.1 type 4b pilus protein PilO2 [Escherichia coli]EJN7219556.1 type 4b pilus protein PilO2 [Citrobacter freundii]HBP7197356.1 type 4b pilus protein PilO2 [Salmonella enterica subsp. en
MNDESQIQHKKIKVITVNGNNFAVGLDWKALNNARKHMKEAKEYGKKNGLDVVAIKKGDFIQAGFAPKQAKSIKGMYSLALSLVSIIPGAWIGVFPIHGNDEDSDQYILVASGDNGAVIPWTDVVVDKADIKKLVDGLKNDLHDPERNEQVSVIGDISFPWVTQEANLSDVLTSDVLKKDYKLKPLTFGLTRKQIVYIFILLAVAIAALLAINYYLEQQAIEAERLRQAEIARQEEINKQAKYKMMMESLKHPWIEKPSVYDFIVACDIAIKSIPLSIEGWRPVLVDCENNQNPSSKDNAVMQLVPVYNRGGESTANSDSFAKKVRELFNTEPVFNIKDSTVASFILPVQSKKNGDDPLEPMSERIIMLSTVLQKHGIGYNYVENVQKVETTDETIPPPDWSEIKFSYDSSITPRLIFKTLALDGIRLNRITYKINNAEGETNYSVEGTVYGKK